MPKKQGVLSLKVYKKQKNDLKNGVVFKYTKKCNFKIEYITVWLSNSKVVLIEFQIDCKNDYKVEKRYKLMLK